MPRYMRDVVNLKDYKNLYELTQRGNEEWEKRRAAAGVMSVAAKVQRSHCAACGQQEGSAPLTAVLLRQPQPKAARMAKTGATTIPASFHNTQNIFCF